jgi:uncharacterized membrane protein
MTGLLIAILILGLLTGSLSKAIEIVIAAGFALLIFGMIAFFWLAHQGAA